MKRLTTLHPIKLALISGSLIITGCSFQKGKGDKKDPATNTTVIVENQTQPAKTALEALQTKDLETFKKLLAPMSPEEVNAYTSEGSTLLETAVLQSNLVAVELLLEKGALPLKGQKNAAEKTPLALSENLNISIYKALAKNVEKSKSAVVELIKNKKYAEAFQLQDSHFISFKSDLVDNKNILDLMLAQESNLNASLKAQFKTLLQKEVSLANSKEKILKMSLEDSDFFAAVLLETKSQHLTLSEDFIYSLIQETSLGSLKNNLNILNSHKLSSARSLKILQNDVLKKFLDSLNPGELLPIESLQSLLALLPAQASDKDFCSECIELALNSNKISTQRGDIVRLLILNSEKAPSGFLKSLIGQLTPADFRLVVEALPADIRKSQSDAFDGTWTISEYKTLRDFGLQMSAAQAHRKFTTLLDKRYNGDKQASEVISVLSADLKKMPGLLNSNEQRDLASKEFFFVLESDFQEKDIFDILAAIKSQSLPGLYLGVVPQSKFNPTPSSEELWLNPFYVLQSVAAKGASVRFNIHLPEFTKNVSNMISFKDSDWILHTPSWKITGKDNLWMQLLDSENAIQALYPQLRIPLVKESIAKWMIRFNINPNDPASLQFIAQKIDYSFSDLTQTERENLLSAVLMSPSNAAKNGILTSLLFAITASNDPSKTNFSSGLADFLLTMESNEDKDGFFSKIILPYMKKATPRLALALEGPSALYMNFLKGELTADPLCADEEAKKALNHCAPESTKPIFESTRGNRDPGKAFEESVRQQNENNRRILKVIEHDMAAVSALLKIQKSASGPEINRFFETHSWLLTVSFFKAHNIRDDINKLGIKR